MAEKKPKKAWWTDQSSNFTGGITFGDPMPENVPQSRLDELFEVEKIAYKEPEEVEEVTASQVDRLRSALSRATHEIEGLRDQIVKTPKGVQAAKKEVKTLKDELKMLKESALKTDDAKTEELISAKKRIDDLEGFLTDKDDEIAKLKADLDAVTAPKDGE